METLLICSGMLYLYSCRNVKLNYNEVDDKIKIDVVFDPCLPILHLVKKACPRRRTDEETRQNQNTRSGFEGFQENTNNTVEENNNNEAVTS